MRTTVPGRDGHRAGDLLNRDFTAPAPNRRWVADFTYVAAWSGILLVAFVTDVYSRAIVGWSAATHKRARLVLDALQMALWRRDRDVDVGEVPPRTTAEYVSWYNTRRLHTAIGGIPPAEHEAAYYAQKQPQPMAGPNT